MFLFEIEGPDGWKKVRETRSFYPALIACQKSFMAPGYDQDGVSRRSKHVGVETLVLNDCVEEPVRI